MNPPMAPTTIPIVFICDAEGDGEVVDFEDGEDNKTLEDRGIGGVESRVFGGERGRDIWGGLNRGDGIESFGIMCFGGGGGGGWGPLGFSNECLKTSLS